MTYNVRMTPTAVDQLVSQITYKPGWEFEMWMGQLRITALVPNSQNFEEVKPVHHLFAVPEYFLTGQGSRKDAEEWIMRMVFEVERHEAMEFFAVGGERIFYPAHGMDDGSPYQLRRR